MSFFDGHREPDNISMNAAPPAARIISRDYAQFLEFSRAHRLEIGTDVVRISKLDHLFSLVEGTKVYALSGACVPTTFRQIVRTRRLHLQHLSLAQTDGTVRFTAEGPTPLPES
jgi:hypothetical protein